MTQMRYVLITPAYNEEHFLEATIQSVLNQTVLPRYWVLISDGSTDQTDAIMLNYARRFPFIHYIRNDRDSTHNFSSKVQAIALGVYELRQVDYELIGNLDADMALEPDYYETLIRRFEQDTKLGIAGGKVYEKVRNLYTTYDHAESSVAGAIQLFRRECFEQIGGYLPLRMGGEDSAAEIYARMNGWKVEKYPEIKVYENRLTGHNNRSLIRTKFKQGQVFHSLGYHPLFLLIRSIRRLGDHPWVIGSCSVLAGYFQSHLSNRKILLDPHVVAFVRKEQMERLRNVFRKKNTQDKLQTDSC